MYLGAGAHHAQRVAELRHGRDRERHLPGGQVVGDRPQPRGVTGGADVLDAHQGAVTLGAARRERVEQQIGEDHHPVALVEVRERDLADVGEVARAHRPRERRPVGRLGLREDLDVGPERGVVHDAGAVADVT
jgi:hypothetical protein